MVIHDPILDRTTTGTGPVRALSGASLRALRLKDGSSSPTDERVPTLDEVVALVARTRRQMLVEIKVDERRQRYPGIEEKVLAVLDRHDMAGAAVVMAFERECTETFWEGHVRAFEFFGGVPKRITYDNTKVAVSKILGKERRLTQGFLQLKSHYLFHHHLCRVARGNEKGVVEGQVKFTRLNYFVPV